jgi:hypothetical protein
LPILYKTKGERVLAQKLGVSVDCMINPFNYFKTNHIVPNFKFPKEIHPINKNAFYNNKKRVESRLVIK